MSLGIYVHIPYCVRKCNYCDFKSYSGMNSSIPEYFAVLGKEIAEKRTEKAVDTIFIGGGTPSVVAEEHIVSIIEIIKQNYKVTRDCEISMEINPGTVNRNKLKAYRNAGINRISFGLQSADSEELKALGRIHTYKDYVMALDWALEEGFFNINIDLIFGIPKQTMESFKETLDRVCNDKRINHISLYSLIIEEGTEFFRLNEEGKLFLPDEGIERQMYDYAINYLRERGLIQYEISNFSREGYQCKHNLKYWEKEEYLGFGVSAHSYMAETRAWNYDKIDAYIKCAENGVFKENFEKLSSEDSMKEFMMLGLRLSRGIDREGFLRRYGEKCEKYFSKEIEKLRKMGLVEADSRYIKLTKKGLDFANLAFMEFV